MWTLGNMLFVFRPGGKSTCIARLGSVALGQDRRTPYPWHVLLTRVQFEHLGVVRSQRTLRSMTPINQLPLSVEPIQSFVINIPLHVQQLLGASAVSRGRLDTILAESCTHLDVRK